MATECQIDVFQLTPTGWTEGTEPPDRVAYWRRTVTEDQRVSWRRDWVGSRGSNAVRDAPRAAFQAFMAPAATGSVSNANKEAASIRI